MNEDLRRLVPAELSPAAYKIVLVDHVFEADIGFHDFEIGVPQRLHATVEVWLDPAALPPGDRREEAWDYDFLRHGIAALAAARRYNLQETLARAIYDMIAARHGVWALRLSTRKLDVYPDCAAVGCELASFGGAAPHFPTAFSTKA